MDIFERDDFQSKDYINKIQCNIESEENQEKTLRDCINQITITEKNIEINGEKEMRSIYNNQENTIDDYEQLKSKFCTISSELDEVSYKVKSQPKQKALFDDLMSLSRLKEKTGDFIEDLQTTLKQEESISKLQAYNQDDGLVQNSESIVNDDKNSSNSQPASPGLQEQNSTKILKRSNTYDDYLEEVYKQKRIINYISKLSPVYPLYEKMEIIWSLCYTKLSFTQEPLFTQDNYFIRRNIVYEDVQKPMSTLVEELVTSFKICDSIQKHQYMLDLYKKFRLEKQKASEISFESNFSNSLNFLLKIFKREFQFFIDIKEQLDQDKDATNHVFNTQKINDFICESIHELLLVLKTQFKYIEANESDYFEEIYQNQNLLYNYFQELESIQKSSSCNILELLEHYDSVNSKGSTNPTTKFLWTEVCEILFYPLTIVIQKSCDRESKSIVDKLSIAEEKPVSSSKNIPVEKKDYIEKLFDYKFDKVFVIIQKSFTKMFSLTCGLKSSQWIKAFSGVFLRYLDSFNRMLESLGDDVLTGQKKLVDSLLKGHDGEYYQWYSNKASQISDLIKISKNEVLGLEDFQILKNSSFKKIQVMLFEQLLSKYENFLLMMNNFNVYFEEEEWVSDIETQKVITKNMEELFKTFIKKHGDLLSNDLSVMNKHQQQQANKYNHKKDEISGIVSKELEDVSMKLQVINANFRSLILKFLIRDPILTFLGFFDKQDQQNYLQGSYTVNAISEKFSSFNYLFDQMQQPSANNPKIR